MRVPYHSTRAGKGRRGISNRREASVLGGVGIIFKLVNVVNAWLVTATIKNARESDCLTLATKLTRLGRETCGQRCSLGGTSPFQGQVLSLSNCVPFDRPHRPHAWQLIANVEEAATCCRTHVIMTAQADFPLASLPR